MTLIGSIAELERSLIIERIRAGMRRAKLEGRRLGRVPLDVNRTAIVRDRATMSLTQVAKKHGVSRATVVRLVKEAQREYSVVGQLCPADGDPGVAPDVRL